MLGPALGEGFAMNFREIRTWRCWKLRCSWAVVPAAFCSFSQNTHFHKVFTTSKYGMGPGVSSPHYRVAAT